MLITDNGHVQINYNGKEFNLTPSFLNMSAIGSPQSIVEAFVAVNGGYYPPSIPNVATAQQLADSAYYEKKVLDAALTIIYACCDDDDISKVVGEYEYIDDKRVYRAGEIPKSDVVLLAQHLIYHGVMGGDSQKEQQSDKKASSDLDLSDIVYSIVAHLSISETEAWNMNMTTFRKMIKVKYPEQKNQAADISKEDYEAAFRMAREVMEEE